MNDNDYEKIAKEVWEENMKEFYKCIGLPVAGGLIIMFAILFIVYAFCGM